MPFPSRTTGGDHARSVRESGGPRDAPPTSGSEAILSRLARTGEWREGGAHRARPPVGRSVEVGPGTVPGVLRGLRHAAVVDAPRLEERHLVLEHVIHDLGLALQPPVRAVEGALARDAIGLVG